jgi:heme/copper-type cytochrome/quinol oxidase subunit 2
MTLKRKGMIINHKNLYWTYTDDKLGVYETACNNLSTENFVQMILAKILARAQS